MRSLRLALVALCLVASSAIASPTDPKNGAEYVTLQTPQPVATTGKQVEVIEFFMYHCPHCNTLEPELAEWVKKQGDNIMFKRVHFPYSGPNDPEAHLYLTLEAMGKLGTLHDKVFYAIHAEHKRLSTDAAVLEWAVKAGLDKAKFLEFWNSFGVMTKLKRLSAQVAAYKVDGAPTLVVDGKYMTAPSIVGAANTSIPGNMVIKASVQTLDALVAKVQKEKSAGKPAGK
jgi:thiol:disulfide interchange protein DsbA